MSELDNLCQKLEPYVRAVTPQNKSEHLWNTTVKTTTDVLAVSISEVLRWAYKENGNQPLYISNSLLPNNLSELNEGRTVQSWHSNIDRTGLRREQVENLLHDFAQAEITTVLEIQPNLYLKRDEQGFRVTRE